MKKIQFVIAVMLLLSISCKKDDAVLVNAKIIENVENTGKGCNWLLEVDNVIYCPTNLDAAYRVDNLRVLVSFNFTEQSKGGFSTGHDYLKIIITEIKVK